MIFVNINSFKKCKKGVIFPARITTWCGSGTRPDATWHARPRGSATRAHESACVARRWRGCVAGPRESTRTPRWHHMAESQAGRWWAHGLVGPGKSIGAVTQRRYAALPYILTYPTNFLRVGLCSLIISSLHDTWQNNGRQMQSYRLRHVNRMNPSPRDHHQSTCVKRNLSERDRRLTLQHVASRGGSDQDWMGEISEEGGSASCNRGVTRGCIFRFSDEDRTGNFRRIMGSWPTIIVQSWPSIGLHRIGRSAFFTRNFLINSYVLPLYLNSWLNRE